MTHFCQNFEPTRIHWEIFSTRISVFYSSLNHPVVAISRSTLFSLCHRRCHGDKWHEVYSRLMTNFLRCIEWKKKRKSGKFYSFPISKNHCCAQNSYYIASHWIKMYKTNNFMERKTKREENKYNDSYEKSENAGERRRGNERKRSKVRKIRWTKCLKVRLFLFLRINHFCRVSFVARKKQNVKTIDNLTCCATWKILTGSLNETMD